MVSAYIAAAIALSPATAPAVITVNSNADGGGVCPGPTCTLRQAIFTALAGETIDFAPNLTTITLTTAELLINKNLTISGPGSHLLTVQRSTADGTPTFRIFNIASGDVTISGLTISNGNALPGGHGGGIFNSSPALTIQSCVIGENRGDASDNCGSGGGIFNSPGATVRIFNSAIAGNRGGSNKSGCGGGGGIFNSAGATVEVVNTTISQNVGGGNGPGFGGTGGGIRNNGGTVTVLNSLLVQNSGGAIGRGGGIYNSDGGTLYLTNSTVTTNSGYGALQASGGAGGIYNNASTAVLTSSTICYNVAAHTSGVFNDNGGTVRVRNTIIAGNTSPQGPSDFFGTLTSEGYVLLGSTESPQLVIIGDTTGNQLNVDPLLDTLNDNGGPTLTHALLPGSTAIDGGHSSGQTTDQRGFSRPIDFSFRANATNGDGSDIGAFEVQTLPPATPTPTPTPSPTPTATPTPSPTAAPALLNISTRARVQTGDRVLIGGFIITGTDLKKVLIRGMGPSFIGLGATLSDPTLELHQGNTRLTTNDNWKTRPEGTSQQAEIEATNLAPGKDAESAILAMLSPQGYTAILAGKDGGTGVGLVEIYDLEQSADARLANISSRGFVDTNDNVMIGGFIVGGESGSGTARIIIRALGPSLPLAEVLANPTVALHDANGAPIASNDDWRSDQEAEIMATTIPPPHNSESAIVRDFAPGTYTAVMRGVGNTSGIGLVEMYYLE